MNKKSYRIVFNAARNQHVAVAETGQSDHGEPGFVGGGQPCGSRPHTAVVQKLSFAIWAALGLVSWAPVAQAQADRGRIVADHSAPSNNQPTILVSPNGTPVVNIQTPSAGGVSRNVYTQFDVGTQGAVLNNSRTGQRTQIGGAVGGNPSLVRGTAKVILNEVNSPAASQLRGTIEVSGDRAQVVIANPSGVSCDGCGFINANRVTITTGTPVMNGGSLENYRVEQGTVTIGAGGMNASGADYTDVISRATVINGKIYAKDLKIILGANEVSADGSRVTRPRCPSTPANSVACTPTRSWWSVLNQVWGLKILGKSVRPRAMFGSAPRGRSSTPAAFKVRATPLSRAKALCSPDRSTPRGRPKFGAAKSRCKVA